MVWKEDKKDYNTAICLIAEGLPPKKRLLIFPCIFFLRLIRDLWGGFKWHLQAQADALLEITLRSIIITVYQFFRNAFIRMRLLGVQVLNAVF